MSYSKKVIQTVSAAYEKRRAEAERKAASVRSEAFAQIPRLAGIEQELRAALAQMTREMIAGDKHAVERMKEKNLALRAERAELLSALSLTEEDLEPQYTCPLCRDTGKVEGYPCACYQKELARESFVSSGLGGALQEQSFDNFDLGYYPMEKMGGLSVRERMAKNVEICRGFAEQFKGRGKNLLLLGATGLGKTHLSSAIARAVAEAGNWVVYDTAGEIFQKLDDKRFGRGTDFSDADSYFDCDLLILDDLGSELTTTLTVAHLFSILNERMNHGKSTVISTNLTPEGITGRYDDKISSRIIGQFIPLPFAGKDIRQQKRMK